MFVILAYDVDRKRVKSVLKKCKAYLKHVQRSVFEGPLTEGQLERLKAELSPLIDPSHDAISIYCVGSVRFASRQSIGLHRDVDTVI